MATAPFIFMCYDTSLLLTLVSCEPLLCDFDRAKDWVNTLLVTCKSVPPQSNLALWLQN